MLGLNEIPHVKYALVIIAPTSGIIPTLVKTPQTESVADYSKLKMMGRGFLFSFHCSTINHRKGLWFSSHKAFRMDVVGDLSAACRWHSFSQNHSGIFVTRSCLVISRVLKHLPDVSLAKHDSSCLAAVRKLNWCSKFATLSLEDYSVTMNSTRKSESKPFSSESSAQTNVCNSLSSMTNSCAVLSSFCWLSANDSSSYWSLAIPYAHFLCTHSELDQHLFAFAAWADKSCVHMPLQDPRLSHSKPSSVYSLQRRIP